jgi:hypothetical protein
VPHVGTVDVTAEMAPPQPPAKPSRSNTQRPALRALPSSAQPSPPLVPRPSVNARERMGCDAQITDSSRIACHTLLMLGLQAGLWPQVRSWAAYGVAAYGTLMTIEPLSQRSSRLLWFVVTTLAFALAPVVRNVLARRHLRPPPTADALVSSEFNIEIGRARIQGRHPWWKNRSETSELPGFFAFWAQRAGYPADSVSYLSGTSMSAESLGLHDVIPAQPSRKKGCLVRAQGLLSDQPMVIHLDPIDWETVIATEKRDTRDDAWSLFGIEGWHPWPSLTVAHCVVSTADGYVLVSLRNKPDQEAGFYFPTSWSVSFEEQIELGACPDPDDKCPDVTLADTASRGLRQEFGVNPRHIHDIRCLAIGREISDIAGRRVRNGGLIVSIQLDMNLAQIWGA